MAAWVLQGYQQIAHQSGFSGPGELTYRERLAWLDEHGIVDAGLRDAFIDLWRAMDDEFGVWQDERREAEEAEKSSTRRGRR